MTAPSAFSAAAVRDQVVRFAAARSKGSSLEVDAVPPALARMLSSEPSRSLTLVTAVRACPAAPAFASYKHSSLEREIVVANLIMFALRTGALPSPECFAELVGFSQRHCGAGAAPELARLRSVLAVLAATRQSESAVPTIDAAAAALAAADDADGAGMGLDAAGADAALAAAAVHQSRGAVAYLAIPLLTPVAPALAPSSSLDLGGRRRTLTLQSSAVAPDDVSEMAAERNAEFSGTWRFVLRPRVVKDYVDTPRTRWNSDRLADEMSTLLGAPGPARSGAAAGAATKDRSAAVAGAIACVVKMTVDGYVAKLALGATRCAPFLREASESLLHILTTMIARSEPLAVRTRAFDVLANVAVHAQLLDRSAAGAAGQRLVLAEVEWVLAALLETLAAVTSSRSLTLNLDVPAVRLLLAGLKATLLVVPPARLGSVVPVQAIVLFLRLPAVRATSIALFDTLCAALHERIVGAPHALLLNSPATSALVRVCPDALDLAGGVLSLSELLVAAPTAASASALFGALYCAHAARASTSASWVPDAAGDAMAAAAMPPAAQAAQAAPPAVVFATIDVKPLRAAVRLGLPWQCRFLLATSAGLRSVAVLRQLVSQDLDSDTRGAVAAFVGDLITGVMSSRCASIAGATEAATAPIEAVCHELGDPRRLAAALDDPDSVVSDLACRLCAQALLHEWNRAAQPPAAPDAAAAAASGAPAAPPPAAVSAAICSVLRVSATRVRASVVQLLRFVIVGIRAALSAPPSSSQSATASRRAPLHSASVLRNFAAFLHQCFDATVAAGASAGGFSSPAASLPYACALTRVVLESCCAVSPAFASSPSARATATPPSVSHSGDVVVGLETGALVVVPAYLETVGGTATLWRMYRALRAAADTGSTLPNQACAQLRLVLLLLIVSLVERSAFDAADTPNWRLALSDSCGQCCAVVANHVVRAVSEPFEVDAAGNTVRSASNVTLARSLIP
jgi:hypothetical protein